MGLPSAPAAERARAAAAAADGGVDALLGLPSGAGRERGAAIGGDAAVDVASDDGAGGALGGDANPEGGDARVALTADDRDTDEHERDAALTTIVRRVAATGGTLNAALFACGGLLLPPTRVTIGAERRARQHDAIADAFGRGVTTSAVATRVKHLRYWLPKLDEAYEAADNYVLALKGHGAQQVSCSPIRARTARYYVIGKLMLRANGDPVLRLWDGDGTLPCTLSLSAATSERWLLRSDDPGVGCVRSHFATWLSGDRPRVDAARVALHGLLRAAARGGPPYVRYSAAIDDLARRYRVPGALPPHGLCSVRIHATCLARGEPLRARRVRAQPRRERRRGAHRARPPLVPRRAFVRRAPASARRRGAAHAAAAQGRDGQRARRPLGGAHGRRPRPRALGARAAAVDARAAAARVGVARGRHDARPAAAAGARGDASPHHVVGRGGGAERRRAAAPSRGRLRAWRYRVVAGRGCGRRGGAASALATARADTARLARAGAIATGAARRDWCRALREREAHDELHRGELAVSETARATGGESAAAAGPVFDAVAQRLARERARRALRDEVAAADTAARRRAAVRVADAGHASRLLHDRVRRAVASLALAPSPRGSPRCCDRRRRGKTRRSRRSRPSRGRSSFGCAASSRSGASASAASPAPRPDRRSTTATTTTRLRSRR